MASSSDEEPQPTAPNPRQGRSGAPREVREDAPPKDDLLQPTASSQAQRIAQADRVRGNALWWILGLLTGVLALGGAAAFVGGSTWADVKEYLQLVLAGITGLVGIAIGYYFGKDGVS